MAKTSTKRALLTSVLSLVLCLSMLIGTTFAWFTDSVTSANNIIKSGRLDVELEYSTDATNWTPVTDSTNIFKDGALWEPGYTEVVYLKVSNKGNLALKYNLGVNIVSETGSTNVNEKEFKLSDYIYFGTIGGAQHYTREEAALIATKKISAGYTTNSFLENGGDEDIITMVVHMPTYVNNDANYAEGESVPTINLGVKLFATQYTSEEDGMGDNRYDAAAPWTGAVDKTWYDAAATEFVIDSPEKLAGFVEYTNEGVDFYGKTVKLSADFDLRNIAWTPAGIFRGTFDGQGHTIYNLTIAKETHAAMFAELRGTVKNVNFDGVTLISTRRAGVVSAFTTDGCNAFVSNCHVNNATITVSARYVGNKWDDGDKAGGIVGYMGPSNPGIADCSVSNTTIKAYRDLAGIVGYCDSPVKNCVVGENVKVVVDATNNYHNYTTPDEYDAASYVGDGNSVPTGCTGSATIEAPKAVATVSTAEELKTALTTFSGSGAGNNTINITADIILADGENWTPVTIQGYTGAGKVTVNGNGHTISGLNAPLFAGGFAGKSGIIVNDLTLADVNINDTTEDQGLGAFVSCIDSMPEITLNNCHLKDSTIVSTGGARVGGLIGWSAGYNNPNDGPVDTYININKCSVINVDITADGSVGAIIGHAGNNPATFHFINDCVVRDCNLTSTDTGGWRVGVVVGTANDGQVTITNTTESGNVIAQTGKTAPAHSNLYGRFVPNSTGKLTIDGVAISN